MNDVREYDPNSQQTTRYPSEEWDKYKDEIVSLYASNSRTVAEIREVLREKGLPVT
jgi:hypothetical protein